MDGFSSVLYGIQRITEYFSDFSRLLTKNFDYWKKRGIPHVPAVPIFGSAIPRLSKVYRKKGTSKKYGRIYGYFEGTAPGLNITEPDLIKTIFVKDFSAFPDRRDVLVGHSLADNMLPMLQGEAWKRVRTIITPTFATGKIKKMTNAILISTKCLARNVARLSESKKTIDAKKMFGCFTADVIAITAFATKVDSLQDPENEFVRMAQTVFYSRMPWRFLLLIIMPRVAKFFHVAPFPPTTVEFFKNFTLEIAKERIKAKTAHSDFLQLLMNASEGFKVLKSSDVTAENMSEEGNEHVCKPKGQYNTLSQDELVAQCIAFLFAGYDTTASTLTFISYVLALNPDVQEKLIAEVDQTIKDNNGELTYDAVRSMKYLDKVISETLRMHGPVLRFERTAVKDYKIESLNITIPKGMIVACPLPVLHYDPEFYPNPTKFDPERFSEAEVSRRHPYAYLPFGTGPRSCVAMRFALLEIKLCITYLLSQFRFKRSPKTKIPPEFLNSFLLVQLKELFLDVEVRADKIYNG